MARKKCRAWPRKRGTVYLESGNGTADMVFPSGAVVRDVKVEIARQIGRKMELGYGLEKGQSSEK